MSRGYYGLFGDTIYEVKMPSSKMNTILTALPINVSTRIWNGDQVDVSVHLSNLVESAPTNAEMIENIIGLIDKNQLTSLPTLENSYKMLIFYTITDTYSNETLDTGALVKEVVLAPAIFPLGLTEENEFIGREALTTGTVKFTRNYRKTVPIGASMRDRGDMNRYSLHIERIQLQQEYTAVAEDLSKDDKSGLMKKDYPPPAHVGLRDLYPPHPEYYNPRDQFPNHPSMGYTLDPAPKSKNYVVIYDTVDEGIQLDDVYFQFTPNQLSVHIDLDLNNYAIAGDATDVITHLEANAKTDDTSETTEPVSDDNSGLSDADSNPGDNGVEAPDTEEKEESGNESSETPSTSDNTDNSEQKEDDSEKTETSQNTEDANPSTSEEQKTDSEDSSKESTEDVNE